MTGSEDTIAAIATARGKAALAIVRVSGPDAFSIVSSCLRGKQLSTADSHTAHVGYIVDSNGNDIDQVVVTVFRQPRSATGENIVEVSCHGGDTAPQLVLRELLDNGARMADPGEFTERAFLNGKIDLAQAEAVADLIHSSSALAHRVSMSHLKGRYSEKLQEIRSELLDLSALTELELDFADEDVEFADKERLENLLLHTKELIDELLSSYQVGAVLRDGVRVVIGGRPNAGKSTLLNALVGHDRAIVSETPGTTRDEIEADTEIEGVRFQFVDTAGLRDTSDAIEAEGVRRAEESIETGDVLLYVYDLSRGMDAEEEEFLRELQKDEPELTIILLGNKSDLVNGRAEQTSFEELPYLALSAERGQHSLEEIEPLKDTLADTIADERARANASNVVTNQRHRQHLRKALTAVESALDTLNQPMVMGDMLSLDLRQAMDELGAITGEMTNDDVLDRIFSQFCIGK
jgi:tRNA modification GTPase